MSKESPIVPTVGRVVLVRGYAVLPGEPHIEVPGQVVEVHSDHCISVQAFAKGSLPYLSSVDYDDELVDDASVQAVRAAWRWMPYQVQQARVAAADTPVPQSTDKPDKVSKPAAAPETLVPPAAADTPVES